MLKELIIVNFASDCQVAMPRTFTNLAWQTCLRRIIFLHQTELSLLNHLPDHVMHIYRGQQAYQFLLEVICGLQSPLLGETAVMGQFRAFRANAKFAPTAWGDFLRQLLTDLLVDARHIRHQHLEGLGCQSYGSLIRKHLKSCRKVALLGTGNLAHEILPWLIDIAEVRVFYRSPLHASELQAQHPQIQLDQFTMVDAGWVGTGEALVVAAPIGSEEIDSWLELQSASFSPVVDLRSDAFTDPIQGSAPLLTLSDLFDSLSYERKRLEQRKLLALNEIKVIAKQRYQPAARLCA